MSFWKGLFSTGKHLWQNVSDKLEYFSPSAMEYRRLTDLASQGRYEEMMPTSGNIDIRLDFLSDPTRKRLATQLRPEFVSLYSRERTPYNGPFGMFGDDAARIAEIEAKSREMYPLAWGQLDAASPTPLARNEISQAVQGIHLNPDFARYHAEFNRRWADNQAAHAMSNFARQPGPIQSVGAALERAAVAAPAMADNVMAEMGPISLDQLQSLTTDLGETIARQSQSTISNPQTSDIKALMARVQAQAGRKTRKPRSDKGKQRGAYRARS